MAEPLKTKEEIIQDLRSPFKSTLNKGGIDDDHLIKQLKREFDNEEVKFIKVRGQVDSRTLPKNYRVISKPRKYEDGDTVIECRVHNISISQNARKDVHKLRGDYPAEKHELSGAVTVIPALSPGDRKLLTEVADKVIDGIISKHRREIESESRGK